MKITFQEFKDWLKEKIDIFEKDGYIGSRRLFLMVLAKAEEVEEPTAPVSLIEEIKRHLGFMKEPGYIGDPIKGIQEILSRYDGLELTAPASLVQELEFLLCPAINIPEAKDKWWLNKIGEILSRCEPQESLACDIKKCPLVKLILEKINKADVKWAERVLKGLEDKK